MPDAYRSQINPVSDTYYPVLAATSFCRVRQASVIITWGVTQPTPIRIRFLIDGIYIIHYMNNPVSGTAYSLIFNAPYDIETNQNLIATPISLPFWYEGRNIVVEVNITWGVTQPTPIICRVKYAVLT